MKKIKIILWLILIFIMAVAVWYAPILFKGYNSTTLASHALLRAKNFALTNKYSAENELNVILAPELIEEQGVESAYGNKLNSIVYAYAIKYFNLRTNHQVILFNAIILALALIFFTLTVYYIFNLKVAAVFSLIYIFLPTHWELPQLLIGYEFPLLFLALGFLFFSLGTQKFNKQIKDFNWSHRIYLIVSGVWLIFSCLAREAFFLILPILFIFLLFTKFKKYILYIFIPVIIIFVTLWLPDFLTGKNTYLLFFNNQAAEELKGSDFAYYSHLFPDPYTYHFNRQNHLEKEFNITSQEDLMVQLGKQKILVNMGFGSVNLWQRFKVATPLFIRHLVRFLSIPEIGGPMIFLLLFLGLHVLKKQKKYWFSFALSWMLGSIFLLAYVNLSGRNHLMDFGWLIALLSALGLIFLVKKLSLEKNNKIIHILIVCLVVYNLILASHVMWGQNYDKSPVPKLTAYINYAQTLEIDSRHVIAAPFAANNAYNFNFNTGQSIVVFVPTTIEQLLAEEKLAQAFETFKVTHILGYSPQLSEKIIEHTQVSLVADSSLPFIQEDENINNKNWFLNLVK